MVQFYTLCVVEFGGIRGGKCIGSAHVHQVFENIVVPYGERQARHIVHLELVRVLRCPRMQTRGVRDVKTDWRQRCWGADSFILFELG